jgi:hypothetical protein
MALLATALACAAMAGGGGPAVEPPPSVARFKLTYDRSGGLRPDSRSLSIAPGRRATARVRAPRSGHYLTVHFRIGVKPIRRLRNALERADFEAIDGPGPAAGACPDCYLYAIRYRGHQVAFTEADAPARLRSVVGRIESLIDAHLPRH